ncbi:MAG: class F sortase [Propionibacteriaceae bacterium]|nr:class F sortase [Propionibacteriaceae bacterium]
MSSDNKDLGSEVMPESPVTTEVPEEEEEKKKKRGGIWLILLSVLLIAGGVVIGVMSFKPAVVPEYELYDMDGNRVIMDDPSATTDEFLEAAQMVLDDGGAGLRIPTVKLAVPLGSVNDVNGVMNPPNFTSAFWVRNRGVSLDQAEQGTVYIVTHSSGYGRAPGNYLQKGGQSALTIGDYILVNDRTYVYTEARIIPQDRLAEHADLWENIPNRVLLITCQLGTGSKYNLVIIGELLGDE